MSEVRDALALGAETYYWKPMAALFSSITFRVLGEAGVVWREPVLDLGCGDGLFARMLHRGGLAPRATCGVDLSPRQVRRAREANAHDTLLVADARRLPFRDASFATIVCNGVLVAVPGGVERAVAEGHRVLRPGGRFVITVATDDYVRALIAPRWLAAVSPRARRAYVRRLNARLGHLNLTDAAGWRRALEDRGLRVVVERSFFAPPASHLWNLLSLQAFRSLALARCLRAGPVRRLLARGLARALAPACRAERRAGGPHGYLLLVAAR